MKHYLRLMPIVALLAAAVPASAVDTQGFSLQGSASGAAGADMVSNVGQSTLSVVQLVMGPGMLVVIAIGAVLALYGYAREKKEALWTGVVLFVLAALLKGLWAFL